MSEEAPLRDRSHIDKTLMLDEDKPADDFSGNQGGRRLGWGWGASGKRAPQGGSPGDGGLLGGGSLSRSKAGGGEEALD